MHQLHINFIYVRVQNREHPIIRLCKKFLPIFVTLEKSGAGRWRFWLYRYDRVLKTHGITRLNLTRKRREIARGNDE